MSLSMLSRRRKILKWVLQKKEASQTTDTESEIKPSHASDVRPGTRALPSPYTTSRKKRRTNSPRASPPRLDLALQFPTGRDVPSTRDAVSSTALHAEHLDAATPSRPPVRRMHGAMPSSLTIKHRAHDSPPPCGSASPRTPPPSRHVDGGALVTSKRTRAPRELKTVMKTTLKKKKGPVLSRSYGAGEHRIDGIDVVVSSVLLYGHLQPDNATDAQPLDVPVHYWRKRYFLFSRFDEGVMMDSAAWFETTPEIIAAHIAWRLSDCSTICDGTAGVGGNAVQFARQDMRVECVDINKKRLRMCSRNAKIYGVRDRLKFHVGDFCAVPPVVVDAVFLSPPWGGPECFKSRSFSLDPVYHDGRIRKREGVTCDIPQMFARATLWSRTVVLFLPHHTDLRSLSNLARKHGYPHFEAEKIYYQLGGKMHFKILTVYFGHPRRHSDA
eukprot:GEMP01038239.1.p1 GENE.GEMP01038239.1~~GEMP01038239.1.p1  ORF type:complete len:442 (+),score=98.33 GEMP01038239.1:34-1359(+)